MEKLKRKALPETLESALCEVHDAVGVRVICSFADDVFRVEKWLKSQENYELIKEKDYISYPKPNGYRGIHLIRSFGEWPEKRRELMWRSSSGRSPWISGRAWNTS